MYEKRLVVAVAGALAYTEVPAPSKEQFGEALRRLSASIEEIRGRYARADVPVTPQALSKLKRDPRHGVRQIYESLKKRYERELAERTRLDAMLNFERVLWRAGVQHIAGVDEVGMGPLAGPVVAAAVVLPARVHLPGLDDSKRLAAAARERLAEAIHASALAVAVAELWPDEIDRLVPTRINFRHQYDTPQDAAGHIKSALVGPSQTFIIDDGQLVLGHSQKIYFFEFDGPRKRQIYVQVLGSPG
jgi:hypothetical protein